MYFVIPLFLILAAVFFLWRYPHGLSLLSSHNPLLFFSRGKLSEQDYSDLFHLPCKREVGNPPGRQLKKKAVSYKNLLEPARRNLMANLRAHSIDLALRDMDGNLWNLRCYQDKKSLVINLWATWCAPCIEELMSLSHLADKAKDHALVLAVSNESPKTLSRFMKRSFPDLKDSLKIVSLRKEIQNQYFPEDPLPVTYIFNKQGRLSLKISGARDWTEQKLWEIVQTPP